MQNHNTKLGSKAILFYLAEKTGRLLPVKAARYQVMQWVKFQSNGIGLMQGQAVALERYFKDNILLQRVVTIIRLEDFMKY